MAEKMLYVLAQFDHESQAKFRELQSALVKSGIIGKQTPDIPYHLTLGSFDLNQETELKKRLQMVCEGASSFEVTLSHIGLFGLNVLFLAPNVTHELLDLQSHFAHGSRDAFEWTAHATLLLDESNKIQKALPIVAENFKPFRARIDCVSLYEFWPVRHISDCKLKL
ncbi:2'-5' RNA ligase family protein [Sporolactobacillus laevolacticus]|uniref:2'-5' RNA ligase family protein n=1 Tax=Sporolactobacillus laevolacticus TaxID=33018 RepID=UPI0025B54AA4|nr:2'-5' RNA ligase family protein [Sporolactobacillus laevolacticus]MDN3955972.1 2'-5' RNA ligase family protein [Sporolactobacillus laevolacticus]